MDRFKNIAKYLFFFAVGIFLFAWVYREYDLTGFVATLKELKWGWVFLSLLLALLSHFVRAIRWNMLIEPLGYKARLSNTFSSVLVLYATNLVIPRGGELARCTVLSRYEKIPFGKLVGTVVTERTTDTLFLLILVFSTIFSQIGVFEQFMINNPQFGNNFGFLFSAWFWILGFIIGMASLVGLYKFRHRLKQISFIGKLYDLLFNFFEGIKSIKKLKHPGWFIFLSILIYVLYFFMMYVVFFSYAPTNHVPAIAGLTAFIMGGLAMLMPVQGGIGAWHFMVIETLAIYGLAENYGKNFALISHTSMNLMLLIAGAIAFIALPFINHKKQTD
ncbi:MAG: flippase-like domain-containing protein [Salinivirgaceae bacterium]|nr:flippase-like domain-containing protein [Salinivirgaceae bacterium]